MISAKYDYAAAIPFIVICIGNFFTSVTNSIHKGHLNNIVAESCPSSGGSTEALALQYFSTLSKREAEELYDYYKFDFDAFGYDHKEFLAAAKLFTNGTEDLH